MLLVKPESCYLQLRMSWHDAFKEPQKCVNHKRHEDALSLALGGKETSGRVRGVGYGFSRKFVFPEDPELAKLRRSYMKEHSLCQRTG